MPDDVIAHIADDRILQTALFLAELHVGGGDGEMDVWRGAHVTVPV